MNTEFKEIWTQELLLKLGDVSEAVAVMVTELIEECETEEEIHAVTTKLFKQIEG